MAQQLLLPLGCWADSRLYFRLSHSALAAGCLEAAGLAPEAQEAVLKGLQELELCPKGRVAARLAALGLTEQAVSSMTPLLEAEGPLSQLSSLLRAVTKRRCAAAERVKAALGELRRLETQAAVLGLSLETVGCSRS